MATVDHSGGTVENALAAAYPVIRADVIAEIVSALREWGVGTGETADSAFYFQRLAADFIEREFGQEG